MKIAKYFFVVFLASCSCLAQNPEASGISPTVNNIEVHRVGEQLVRIIRHNMELEAVLELELFQPPAMKLIDYRKITQVTRNGNTIDFKSADAIYVDAVEVTAETLKISFDYFPPKGSEVQFDCTATISPQGFSAITCN